MAKALSRYCTVASQFFVSFQMISAISLRLSTKCSASHMPWSGWSSISGVTSFIKVLNTRIAPSVSLIKYSTRPTIARQTQLFLSLTKLGGTGHSPEMHWVT